MPSFFTPGKAAWRHRSAFALRCQPEPEGQSSENITNSPNCGETSSQGRDEIHLGMGPGVGGVGLTFSAILRSHFGTWLPGSSRCPVPASRGIVLTPVLVQIPLGTSFPPDFPDIIPAGLLAEPKQLSWVYCPLYGWVLQPWHLVSCCCRCCLLEKRRRGVGWGGGVPTSPFDVFSSGGYGGAVAPTAPPGSPSSAVPKAASLPGFGWGTSGHPTTHPHPHPLSPPLRGCSSPGSTVVSQGGFFGGGGVSALWAGVGTRRLALGRRRDTSARTCRAAAGSSPAGRG